MGNRAHEKTFFSIPRGQVIFSAKMKFAVALAGAAMLLLISGYSAEGCFIDCSKGGRCEPHPGGGSPYACEKAYGCGFKITNEIQMLPQLQRWWKRRTYGDSKT